MRPETLKGHLDLLLLVTIAEEPLHGYAVMEALRKRSDETFDLPEGTVYPALHRLERAGLLTSTWSTASGRRRRTYSLTDKGHTALVRRQREWREFAEAMGTILEGGPWPETA